MESIPVHCESQNCLIKYKKKKKKGKYHHRCDVFLEIPQFALRLVHVDDHKATAAAIFSGRHLPPRGRRGGGDLQKKLCRKSAPGIAGCSFVCLFVCLSSRSTSCGKDSEPEVRPRVWPRFRLLRFSPTRGNVIVLSLFSCGIWGKCCAQSLRDSFFFFQTCVCEMGFLRVAATAGSLR